MKYKTLAALVDAYKRSELDPTSALTLDNDSVSLYVEDPSYLAIDDNDHWALVFDSDPQTLLEEALDLLGIPWDNA